MAEEKSWWDGFTDGLGEFGSDLIDGTTSYFDSEEAKAQADKAASENATATQAARVDNMQRESQANVQQKQTYMMFGGLLLLIVLLFMLKK